MDIKEDVDVMPDLPLGWDLGVRVIWVAQVTVGGEVGEGGWDRIA